MNATVLVLGVAIALAAALRGTWSPCGQSMLSQITPVGEASRGNRYSRTAIWYLLGSVVGGLTLGAAMALMALIVHALHASATVALAIAAGAALLGAVVDSGVLGFAPPFFLRQVNEDWLGKYRAWLYGSGFGWQVGAGVATYIMTAAVFVTIAFGALGASPIGALALGGLFGFARGSTVFLTARARSTPELFAIHRRFDALGEPVRRAVIVVQCLVAIVAAAIAIGAIAGVVVGLATAAVLLRTWAHAPTTVA
ncbi:MAG: hypothetical protein ABW211_00290 [Acidimicrobiia bacterium]